MAIAGSGAYSAADFTSDRSPETWLHLRISKRPCRRRGLPMSNYRTHQAELPPTPTLKEAATVSPEMESPKNTATAPASRLEELQRRRQVLFDLRLERALSRRPLVAAVMLLAEIAGVLLFAGAIVIGCTFPALAVALFAASAAVEYLAGLQRGRMGR